jgi:predicted ferric reductase
MNPVNSGGAWTAVYLGLVLAPLVVLFVGDPVPPGGFWWDLAIALGFAGLAMMSVQFILTARFKRATAPFGIDVIYYFHRYIAGMAFAIVLAHPAIILTANPDLVFYLNPLEAPWFMTVGVLSIVALTLVIVTSYWRGALGISYESWRVIHTGLAVAAVLLALLHVQGVGFYVAEPWKRGLWTVITLSWIGVIGWIRIVKPWRLLRRPYEVAEVRQERGMRGRLRSHPSGTAASSSSRGSSCG